MHGLSKKGLRSSFLWASTMALSCLGFHPPPLLLQGELWEGTDRHIRFTGTLIPESCSNTELMSWFNANNASYLLRFWGSDYNRSCGIQFQTDTQNTVELCIKFFKQYIIIHCVLIFQTTHYNSCANTALTLVELNIYLWIIACVTKKAVKYAGRFHHKTNCY